MKFAIRHPTPNHYLQRETWNWINTLDETTVYTGAEVATRIANRCHDLIGQFVEVSIVAVRAIERPQYEELP